MTGKTLKNINISCQDFNNTGINSYNNYYPHEEQKVGLMEPLGDATDKDTGRHSS